MRLLSSRGYILKKNRESRAQKMGKMVLKMASIMAIIKPDVEFSYTGETPIRISCLHLELYC
jgi:hypothetical protein